MAIGKYLQLYRNAEFATNLAGAIAKLGEATVNEGSPVVVRYKESDEEHALFGVKGKDGAIQYVELATGNSAITNKRLKDLANSLVNSITGETENGDKAYVEVKSKQDEGGPLRYEVKLVNVASNADVAAVEEKVDKIALSDRNDGETSYSYRITLADGSTKDIVIDKDNSLTDIELGNKVGDVFTPSTEGQVIRFTYSLTDGTEKIVDIDLGKAVFDFELDSIVNEALEYATGGKINVKYDNDTIKLNENNQLYVNTTVIDNSIASVESTTRTAITNEIIAAIEALDVDKKEETGKVITAISQTDGKIDAILGEVDAQYVKFTDTDPDTESKLESTNVNAAILELKDKITEVSSEAIGIAAGTAIDITQGEGSTTNTISVKVKDGCELIVENDELAISIADGDNETEEGKGTIKVNDKLVHVGGLGSAAYTASSDYDAAGTAQELIEALDADITATDTTNNGIVTVQVIQIDGKITELKVTEDSTWDCGTF